MQLSVNGDMTEHASSPFDGDAHAAATPNDDWQTNVAWAMALVRSLCEEPSGDARRREQRLADALSSRFRAAALLSVTTTDRGDAAREFDRFLSAGAADTPPANDDSHRVTDIVDLDRGRQATLTVWRDRGAPAFSAAESQWIVLIHAGCAWVYVAAAADAGRRIEQLSPREREALDHLMQGASEKEVAAFLGRSRHTVHSYVKRIYRTLGVCSRSQLRAIFKDAMEARTKSSLRTRDDDDSGEPGAEPGAVTISDE